MGKQFLLWLAAALVGGLLMLAAGSYLGLNGLPSNSDNAFANTASNGDQASTPASSESTGSAASTRYAVGDTPDDFALPDMDGTRQTLAQYRGQPVLLNFWATWCKPCRDEMPRLNRAQKQHPDVRFIGIALDRPDAVRDWLDETPVSYPIWKGLASHRDPAMDFGDSKGLLPYSVLIDSDGEIVDTHMGQLKQKQLDAWLP